MGCPCWYGGRDREPWRSLLEALTVCEEKGTHSDKDAVAAVVCDRRVGGGAAGFWRVLADVVESVVEESAQNLSLGPSERGIVSMGRSAVSPDLLEVGFCSVIPRGRRTPVNVRRRDRGVEDGNDAGVDGPGLVAVEPGRGWILLLAPVGVSGTRMARSAEIMSMAGMEQCRASNGDTEGIIVVGIDVFLSAGSHLKPTA